MRFHETALPGVVLIEIEPVGDTRGHFARTFCAREFAANGLNAELAQSSYSFSAAKATLRGLHFQGAPMMEDKLVRSIRGAIFDVVVDIRPGSPTFGRWFACELSDSNNRQLYIPKGFAHGFQTLSDDAMVSYHISEFYEPDRAFGIRWNDPEIGIDWPHPPSVQSPRDLDFPLLRDLDRKTLGIAASASGA